MDTVIAARYEFRTEVGRGPHGIVWRARHVGTGADCAVKVLHQQFAEDVTVVDRFVRAEAVLTAFLHPAYVRVRELLVDRQQLALVMEFAGGVDLRRHLAAAGPLTPEVATAIVAAAAEAVSAGHDAGVVHCNIKPSNVLLAPGTGQIRITDCRIARLARGPGYVGDDAYAAPEVRSRCAPVRATDVYGLGLVLYEALTATLPLSEERRPHAALPKSINSRLRVTLEQCLATNPDERMSAAQLAADLRRLGRSPETDLGPPDQVVDGHPRLTAAREATRAGDALRAQTQDGLRATKVHGRSSHRVMPARLVVAALAVAAILLSTVIIMTRRSPEHDQVASPGAQPTGSTVTRPRAFPDDSPGLPSSAAADSAAGATAFAYYWFNMLNHAVQTGDDKELEARLASNARPVAPSSRRSMRFTRVEDRCKEARTRCAVSTRTPSSIFHGHD